MCHTDLWVAGELVPISTPCKCVGQKSEPEEFLLTGTIEGSCILLRFEPGKLCQKTQRCLVDSGDVI
ncbi:hypothetical protein ILYODFUR_019442 [Ilyodon furcidens]|uniref:Uncharacterized protein n=1 Tax=Ilyodon furcidens TaxID=33524 RepID=A0ABV0SML4_9TELE